MDAVRIEAARIADSIGMIDAFRSAGLDARPADTPGAWDVEVAGTLDAIAPVLLEWMAQTGHDLMLAHAGERAYLVTETSQAAVPVSEPLQAAVPG